MAYLSDSRAPDVDGLRDLLATELNNRGKALRLVEEGDAANLKDAWQLLALIGEIEKSEIPDRYGADV